MYNQLGYEIALIMESLGDLGGTYWTGLMIGLISLLCVINILFIKSDDEKYRSILFNAFWALVLVSLCVGKLPNCSRGFIEADEDQWILSALSLMHDPWFWLKTNYVMGRPLTVLPLLITAPIGINNATVQIVNIIMWFIIYIILYKTYRILLNEDLSILVLTPIIALVSILSLWSYSPYNSEIPSILLMAISLYALLHSHENKEASPSIYFIFGLSTIGLFYAKFQNIPIIILYIVSFAIINRKNKMALFVGIGSFSAPIILTLGFSYLIDDLASVYFWFIDMMYYAQTGAAFETYPSSADNSLSYLDEFILMYEALETKPFLMLLSFSSVAFTLYLIRIKGLPRVPSIILSFLLVNLLTIIYMVLVPKHLFLHYLYYYVFSLYLLFTLLFTYCYTSIGKESKLKKHIPLCFCIIFTLLPTAYNLKNGNFSFILLNENIQRFENPSILTREISHVLSFATNRRIAVWGWQNHQYLACNAVQGTRNPYPVKIINNYPGTQHDTEKYLYDLRNRKPTVFVDFWSYYDKEESIFIGGHRNVSSLRQFINKHYYKIETKSSEEIFVIKTLLNETKAKLFLNISKS